MALTRAQLLAGNQSNGVVLSGQPQGVIAGPGISISNTGIISVDSSSVTGLVKLNDPFAYNSYVWPGADGAAGEFLQTDGAGNLDWATPQGIAVVTVKPTPAPAPADIGELWFDCSTGTLNVYQDCVGSPIPNWFNVAQPGFPVDPGQTGAVPNFTGGNGTQATPYLMSVTSTGVGTTVAIVNTVTVNGLAPYQYVPIVDLNAVINGGRFSFTNYYANASGQLIFNTIFSDLPTSGPGQNYIAAIRVGYATAYIQASVTVTAALTLSQGTITGTPTVGTPVSYTPGVAAGGTPGYTYAYQWKANGNNITGATNAAFTPTSAQVGQTLSVVQTVTDSAGSSVSNTTTASAQTATAPFPSLVWAPTPMGGMSTNPGGISGTYSGTGTTITVSGCIESAVYTPPALPSYSTLSKSITSGQTLAIRWTASALCGNANTNTTMNGTVSDGTYTNSYMLQINRVPAAIGDITDTNVALGATVSEGIATSISGLNSVAYVTAGSGSTGLNIGVSLTAGGPFTSIPAAGSTLFPITNGQTLYVQQTVGSAINTAPGYTAVVKVGDADGVLADEFTYFAQTVNTAVFPGVSFSPVGSPNAAPDGLNGLAGGTNVGTLYGFITSNAWPGAVAATLSSPASGANPTMKMRTGTNAYASTGVPVAGGQTLDLAWNEAYLATVADGSPANGSITGTVSGTTYTNTFTMTVRRAAAWSAPLDPGNAATGTQQTTNAITVNDFNVPVTVSFAAPSTGTLMGNVIAVVGGVSTTINPITTTVTLNPGQSFEVLGDTGGTGGDTYGVKITIGTAAAQDWLVTTSSVPNAIQPPVMSPTGSNLNPAVNSPAGITLGGGTYTVASGSPGPHTSSDWQLFGNLGTSQVNPETSAIVSVAQNAAGAFATGTWPATTYTNDGVYANGQFVVVGNANSGGAFNAIAQVLTSPDGVTWTARNGGGGDSYYGVTYAAGLYVAVGIGSGNRLVRTSPDGITWTTRFNSGAGQLGGVAYGNGIFMAAGSNTCITSTDGLTWTAATNPPISNSSRGLAFGSGKFVVAESSISTGRLAYSTDGTAWTTISSLSSGWFSVTYENGIFLATGRSGAYATSPDGVNWTTGTFPGFVSPQIAYDAAYGNGVWFVVGANGKAVYSSNNGATWTAYTTGTTDLLEFVTFGSDKFIVGAHITNLYRVSDPAGSTTLTLTDNTDLASMQVGDTVVEVGGGADATGTITAIAPGTPSITVAPSSANWSAGVGATAKDTSRTVTVPNQPLVSTNQIASISTTPASGWTTRQTGNEYFFTTAFGAGKFIVGGSKSTGTSAIYSSTDGGVSWSAVTSTAFNTGAAQVRCVDYLNGLWLAGGDADGSNTPLLQTSLDGSSWTTRTTNFGTGSILSISYGNGIYLISGSNGRVSTSPDGTNWTSRPQLFSGATARSSFANGKFWAYGNSGSVLSSSNGITWNSEATIFPGEMTSLIMYAFGKYIAFGGSFGRQIKTSPDAITWTAQTVPNVGTVGWGSNFTAVLAGDKVVAAGLNSNTATSSDGITWTGGDPGFGPNSVSGISYGNGTLVACGASGTIANDTLASTSLTIAGANTDGFAVGNTISNGLTGASAASGTITAISGTSVTVTPQSANWAGGQNLYRGETIVDVANNANLETYFVAQSLLAPSTTYWSRARYSASSTGTVSPWANWASFSTASSFTIPPGTPMGGGYFAGQIVGAGSTSGAGGLDNLGTIYNIIVAPVSSGGLNGTNTSGIQYRTANAANGNTNAQNENFGGLCTDELKSNALYPVFNTFINGATGPNAGAFNLATGGAGGGTGIGGYNDWYLPAKNELEILYFNLKPTTVFNNTSSGINPNAVPPRASNYTSGTPAQTANALFAGGAQAFSTTFYWSSSEVSSNTSFAWVQSFSDGTQSSGYGGGKLSSINARAVRRQLA